MHSRRRTSRSRSRTTGLALSAALLAGVPLLSACGSEAHPGAAAVVGGQRITVAQLENRVSEVREAQRAASPDTKSYEQIVGKSGKLSRFTLQSMVRDRVLDRAARDAGVTVSRAEVQRLRASFAQQAGGDKALRTAWLQQNGVAPARLDESLRTEIAAQKLYRALGADPNTKEGQDAFWKALSVAGKKLRVDVNPRYGSWNTRTSARADTQPAWLREVSKPAGTEQS